MERSTLVLFAGLLALIAGGVTLYLVATARPEALHVPTTLTSHPDRGMAIFTDGEHGFSLVYPEKYTTEYIFTSFYHLPATWRANALPGATGTPIISITGYRVEQAHAYPRYFDTEIRIGASKDPKELARCEKTALEQAEQRLPDVTFGSSTLKAFSFESAGMMQYVKGISYRVLRDGSCIAIEQLQVGSRYHDDPASKDDIADTVLEAKYNELSSVISSLNFVRP